MEQGLRGAAAGVIAAGVLLLVGGVAAVPASAQAIAPRQAADDNRRELEGLNGELAELEAAARTVVDELAATEAAVAHSERTLADLQERLAAAQSTRDEAVARLAVAEGDVHIGVRRLQRSVDQLAAHRQLLGRQVAHVYRFGTVIPVERMAGMLRGLEDAREFLVAAEQLRFAAERQVGVVGAVEDQVADVRRQQTELHRRAAQRRAAEEAAREAGEQAGAMAARQQQYAAAIARHAEQRAELLAVLESARARSLELARDLERESQTLAEQLRRQQVAGGHPTATGQLTWPAIGRMSSGFGSRRHPIFGGTRQHNGIDIAAPSGSPIVAAAAGTVLHAGARGGYGLTVVIDHGDRLATLYAHQSRLVVGVGEVVERGALIGYVGSTGQSTGPHLHFEVRQDGVPRNPLDWLP